VKKVLPLVSLIQSIDSIDLAEKINCEAIKLQRKANILIEVNISREESKHGVFKESLNDFIKNLKDFSNLEINGLMCLAPLIEKEKTRPYFKEMKKLFDGLQKLKQENLNAKILSMGMSNDFDIAIEEGSTMIRIGTKLFGER